MTKQTQDPNKVRAENTGNVTYFASGSNQGGELLALHQAGVHVGCTVCEICGTDEWHPRRVLKDNIAGSGTKVFLDSGAFGEIKFNENGPYVVKPITDEEWDRRLSLYEELGEVLGEQFYPVAPDKVAFQTETLERLTRYADRVRRIRELGANIIVPHQKGELSLTEFNARAKDILGFDDFIVGVPMAKDATTLEDIVELLTNVKVDRLHLLGMGPTSKKYGLIVPVLQERFPETVLFCDSVYIKSVVGRQSGLKPLTVEYDHAMDEAVMAMGNEGVAGWDYTEHVMEPSLWFNKSNYNEFAKLLGLSPAEKKAMKADIDGWLQEDERWMECEWALDVLWDKFYTKKASVGWRKHRGIQTLFAKAAPSPAA